MSQAPFGFAIGQRCIRCGARFDLTPMFEGCPTCVATGKAAGVIAEYNWTALRATVSRNEVGRRPRGLRRFAEFLPVNPPRLVSLGEGDSPLLPCRRLGERLAIPQLYVKNEGQNPTWSWKDRMAAVGVTAARACGASVVAVASTGNQAASVAAYAAAAGLRCMLFTSGTPNPSFRAMMQVYGAYAIATPTSLDRWTLLGAGVRERGWFPLGNYITPPIGSQPFAIEGYKTIAYEIAESLGWQGKLSVFVPVAYGDTLAGIWRGFKELAHLGWIADTPQMVAAEVYGPLKAGMEQGLDHPPTVTGAGSRAISIATLITPYQGLLALRESNGTAIIVSDTELAAMQRLLAETEGIYAEFSSVASLVAAVHAQRAGALPTDRPAVALLSSGGLKDVAVTTEQLPPIPTVSPDMDSLDGTLRATYGLGLEAIDRVEPSIADGDNTTQPG